MASPSLLGLPVELVIKIIDGIRPEDHLNFALASKRLYQISDDVLKRHQQCHRATSVSSDFHPLTVPQLLEKVIFDPIAAWHIRELEFRVLRNTWEQWVAEDPRAENPHSVPEEEPTPDILVDKDNPGLAAYVLTETGLNEICSRFLAQLGYSIPMVKEVRMRILSGEEESLKLLLLALAPGLRSLKIPATYLEGRSRIRTFSHPLSLLSSAIWSRHRLENRIWPPGFASLRSVSIGVPLSRSRGFVYPFSCVFPILLLPNLEYFYISHPHSPLDPENRPRLPRRISTVKHLHLAYSDLESKEMSEMLSGIAKLESFSLQSLHRNGCDVIRLLALYHVDSLKYLDMCDTDVLQKLHERYFSRLSVHGLRMFSSLKYIAIDLLVLLQQHVETRYAHPGQLVTLKPHSDVDRIDLTTILPLTIEYIAFKVSHSNYLLTTPVADAVSKLVAKTISFGAFPKLKAAFFDGLSPQKPGFGGSKPHSSPDFPWFTAAIEAGAEKGIEVCTVWTHPGRQMKARKDELGIPRATSARDMKTGVQNT